MPRHPETAVALARPLPDIRRQRPKEAGPTVARTCSEGWIITNVSSRSTMTTVTILPPSSMASPMQVQFSLRGHSGARSPAVRAAETVMEAVAMSLEHLAHSDADRSARLLARAAEGAKPPCPFHEGCLIGSDPRSAASYTAPGTTKPMGRWHAGPSSRAQLRSKKRNRAPQQPVHVNCAATSPEATVRFAGSKRLSCCRRVRTANRAHWLRPKAELSRWVTDVLRSGPGLPESLFACIDGCRAQLFLDAEQLVVFRQAVAARR